jgi:hypothetical protein
MVAAAARCGGASGAPPRPAVLMGLLACLLLARCALGDATCVVNTPCDVGCRK